MPFPSRPLRCAIGAALLAIAAIVLSPGAAQAHAILEASTPPAGGSVAAGTVAIELRYNSRIDKARSRLVLVKPDHSEAKLPIAQDGAPERLQTSVSLTPGAYDLRWQVLAIDGHITRGDVRFDVTGP
ncbi:MAG: copper resistance protein CopC [Rhodospirillales bacterium]|nr:copper resistance protein CopC [Rhodospirillales bacterium]